MITIGFCSNPRFERRIRLPDWYAPLEDQDCQPLAKNAALLNSRLSFMTKFCPPGSEGSSRRIFSRATSCLEALFNSTFQRRKGDSTGVEKFTFHFKPLDSSHPLNTHSKSLALSGDVNCGQNANLFPFEKLPQIRI